MGKIFLSWIPDKLPMRYLALENSGNSNAGTKEKHAKKNHFIVLDQVGAANSKKAVKCC